MEFFQQTLDFKLEDFRLEKTEPKLKTDFLARTEFEISRTADAYCPLIVLSNLKALRTYTSKENRQSPLN